jgi:transcriptional regulator with XRE-family HTH domain
MKNKREIVRRVGHCIAVKRKAKGLTQAEIAEQMGVETETISRIENGVISPSLIRLEQLAELLSCSISSFFMVENDKTENLAGIIVGCIQELPAKDKEMILRVVTDISDNLKRHVYSETSSDSDCTNTQGAITSAQTR